MQPLPGAGGVAGLADELGDGGEVSVEQVVGAASAFGGEADQLRPGGLQPVEHLGVDFAGCGDPCEPAGFGDGPLVGENGQRAAGVGDERPAVQGGHQGLSE